MAKKAELQEQATKLGLEFTDKATIKDLEDMIGKAEESTTSEETTEEEPKVAKAGKRSAKAVKEAEELAEKEDRKAKLASGEIEEDQPVKRGPVPKTRLKIERRGKNYKKAAESIDRNKIYELKEGVKLAVAGASTKFDSSLETHIKLTVDPKQADQNIRGTVVLPHGTGKEVKVAVFAPADAHKEAKDAGADIVGEDDFLKMLDKEQIDFDVLIATPQLMAKLGKYAKQLGPKGLMPNPKSGTVTPNVAEAVTKAKAGQVEFRVDSQGIVHAMVGKVSFGADKLTDNIAILIKSINEARPASVKGSYVEGISISSSMGPGIRVNQG